mgnify:CR=1 FL=1|jgi:Trypsin-like serine proteases, typically periplasmic, contain C-terminal PDZ domain
MEWGLEWLKQAGSGIAAALIQPFGYIAVLLVLLLAFRQIRAERRLFHARLTAWPGRLIAALPAGLAVGALVSAAVLFLGLDLNADAVIWLWCASLLLGLVRLRFAAAAYGAGLVAFLQWLAGWFDWSGAPEWIRRLAASLASFDAAGLLLIAGLLLPAEALLLWRFSRRLAGPVVMDGKRGRPIGGWRIDAVWPVPLLLLVPAAGSSAGSAELPWTPLFWSLDEPMGWAMLGLPVVIGSVWRTTSLLPAAKAARAARTLLWTGLIAAAAGAAAARWELLLPAAAAALPALREIAAFIERSREAAGSPLYAHEGSGLRVLAVLPGSSGAQLGIEPGEIVSKVNGIAIRTPENLYDGLMANPAFCKIELINHEGHVRFVQRARYENEHHQLGLVLAPFEDAAYTVSGASRSLIGLLPWSRPYRRRGGAAIAGAGTAASAAPADASASAAADVQAASEPAAADERPPDAGRAAQD